MWGCLGIVLILILALGGAVTWRVLRPPRSDNMQLGERVSLLTTSIDPTGGRLAVEGAELLNGLSIDVPAGAYERAARFRLSARPIEGHRFGPTVSPITPLIQVDNGHGFAAEPMRIEIPIALQPGQFAMAFFYDEIAGTLEGLPTAELAADRIAVLTSHFSSLFVSVIDAAALEAMGDVDTGFLPGVDDWQFPNHGSIVAPGGHCAGQSITAMWYYDQQRLAARAPTLYGLYDNNARAHGTPQLWQDDAWGYRFASSAHKAIDWGNSSAKITRSLGRYDDRLTLYSFVYAMQLTGEPQYVSVGRYVPDPQDAAKTRREGHALIAYKFEGGKLYVADPNYPGQAGRSIPFADGRFKPYASGANVAEIEAAGPKDFTEIRYLAKSALIDWNKIDTLYKAMLKGKAGEGLFPAYTLAVATGRDEQGELIWSTFPEVLQLDEEQTAQMGEAYRGQALVKLEVPSGVAYRTTLYEDTSEIERADVLQPESTFLVPLKVGNNEIGVYTQLADGNSHAQYNDFWRIKVAYGRIDLTGTWEGTFQVEDMGVIRRWIEDAVVRILLWTGLSESEGEARTAVSEIVVEDASVYQERPVTLTLDPPSPLTPNRYPAHAVYSDDTGQIEESSGEAIYEAGELRLQLKHADRSVLRYSGTLAGGESSYGTFSIDAWGGIVRNALSGSWRMSRVGP